MSAVEPWSFVAGDGTPIDVTEEHLETARCLIEEGWHQVSRRYRSLARLPDGLSGVTALIDAELRSEYPHPDLESWAKGLGDTHAGDHYLRCYALRDGNVCELDIPTFAAFRKLGGDTYMAGGYKNRQERKATGG
jgi:hypothetical protein